MNAFEALESSLLGALIASENIKEALPEIRAIIDPEKSLSQESYIIWQALEAINERSIPNDPSILISELSIRGQLEKVGGIEKLVSMVSSVPNVYGYAQYAKELLRLNERKTAGRIAKNIQDKIQRNEPLNGELLELDHILSEKRAKDLTHPKAAPEILEGVSETTDWVLEPLYMRGGITQIQGPPKGGKSSFALYTALCLAAGVWKAGKFDRVDPKRVLYVAYEDGLRRMKRRLWAYARGLGLSGLPHELLLFPQTPSLYFPRDLDAWRKIVSDAKADLVFFDTVAYTHLGDENKASEMAPVMNAVKRLSADCNSAVALVHHTRKPGTQGDVAATSEKGRGSSIIAGAHDIILDWGNRVKPNTTSCELVSKESEDGKGEFNVEYLASKDENDNLIVEWRVHDALEREDIVKTKDKIRSAIAELLKSFPEGAPRSEIASKTGIPEMTVYKYLKVMSEEVESKKVEKNKKLYKLKPPVDLSNIIDNT